jgi:hypothetical protein
MTHNNWAPIVTWVTYYWLTNHLLFISLTDSLNSRLVLLITPQHGRRRKHGSYDALASTGMPTWLLLSWCLAAVLQQPLFTEPVLSNGSRIVASFRSLSSNGSTCHNMHASYVYIKPIKLPLHIIWNQNRRTCDLLIVFLLLYSKSSKWLKCILLYTPNSYIGNATISF